MISDDDVRRLFQNNLRYLAEPWQGKVSNPQELYRGRLPDTWVAQHPGGCSRHLTVFNKFSVIPKYCFDCYKVLVEPRTVMELFKLKIVFDDIELKNNNTRKCTVEGREGISGTYKGLIYCRGINEGEEICKLVQEVVSKEISNKICVTLKRGCSEYALVFPEYALIRHDETNMSYNEEWQKYEELTDRDLVSSAQGHVIGTFNSPEHAPLEARIMLVWLKYAATIGDTSYLGISGKPLNPYQNLKRPKYKQP